MRILSCALLAVLVPLSACHLYFGDDDDPPCDYGGAYPAPGEDQPGLRNPETGACEYYGGGYYPCDGVCGPCTGTAEESDQAGAIAIPSWGFCASACTGLDEQSCMAVDGCRAIYVNSVNDDGPPQFNACWQIDQGGVVTSGECSTLDAYACSTRDDCTATHQATGSCWADGLQESCEPGNFVACNPEPSEDDGCYSSDECDAGYECNASEICLPPPGSCGAGEADPACDVPAVCWGYCVPVVPNPGECDGIAVCAQPPPSCPEDSVPGILNGCWSGYCIPLADCPQTPCDQIAGESMCIARADCSPFYVGIDCTCDGDACSCTDWEYESCEMATP